MKTPTAKKTGAPHAKKVVRTPPVKAAGSPAQPKPSVARTASAGESKCDVKHNDCSLKPDETKAETVKTDTKTMVSPTFATPAVSQLALAEKSDGDTKSNVDSMKSDGLKEKTLMDVKVNSTTTPDVPDASSTPVHEVNTNKTTGKGHGITSSKSDEPGASTTKPKKVVKKVVVRRKVKQPLNEPSAEGKQIARKMGVSDASKLPKVVKKVVGKDKSKEVQKLPKQEKETTKENSADRNVEGTSKEVLKLPLQNKQTAKEKSIEPLSKVLRKDQVAGTDNKEDDEMVDDDTPEGANEGLDFYDDDFDYQEVEEGEGADGEVGFQTDKLEQKPMSEKQKRKQLEVFVGGLDKDATEDDLRAVFEQIGDIVDVRLMMNTQTGKNKGYAFIRFATAEQAARAAKELSITRIRGKECGVQPNKDNDILFIGNISRDWKASEVLQKLKEYGVDNIEELTLVDDYHNEGLNRGYAFLELATHYDALNAFQRLQQSGITFGHDRPAKVSWAEPMDEPNDAIMSQVRSVFVDGMPSNWSDGKVRHHFERFGEIERIVFARSMPVAKRKDFAFVNYIARESALACAEAFREVELNDGDFKVKLRVSLARPAPKKRFGDWSGRTEQQFGAGRQAGRGEGWFSGTHAGFKRGGRGFSWSGGRAILGRGGKRLYDEDDVRMLLRLLREEEDLPVSTTRGRQASGPRVPRTSRGAMRGAYNRNDDKRHFEARPADHREDESRWNDANLTRGAHHRAVSSEHGAPKGRGFKTVIARDDYGSHGFHRGGSSYKGRGSFTGQRAASRYEEEDHHPYTYEGGEFEVQEYDDPPVGMKRPAEWEEDASYYDASHRGYPRARVDYAEAVHLPEDAANYSVPLRSERAVVPLGREEPTSSFYNSGSGLAKAGSTSLYHHAQGYDSILPETTGYISLEAPEIRGGPLYASSLYGGHSGSVGYDGSTGYDVQPRGYY